MSEETNNPLVPAIIVSIIVVFGLDPLKRWIGRLTDAIFFKGAINYDLAAKNLAAVINREIELQKLIDTLDDALAKELKAEDCHIMLSEHQTNVFVTSALLDRTLIVPNDPDVHVLLKKGQTYVNEEVERYISDERKANERDDYRALLKAMEGVGAATITPLIIEDKLIGIILMEKKRSGDVYSGNDISLIDLVASQLAVAVEKAKLFEEVRTFSEKLKMEVDSATKDLADANVQLKSRNLYLNALQTMTSLITRSLDFSKVTQAIVDGIAKELGYVGGVLVLLDKDTSHTYAAAITETPLTKKAIQLMPKNPMKYYGRYLEDKTLGVAVIKTGAIQISERFADWFHPPMPKLVCQSIQKMLRAKTFIGVPISVEHERIGVIIFVLKKQRDTVSEDEINMMKSLADQMGIVTRNVRLYEEISNANAQLEQANVRLKRLDEAKNDFISITSHQLRTPLSGIVGYLSMLVGGDFGPLKPDVNKIMTQVLDASKRLVRLVNIFLNISKIESGRLQIVKSPVQIEDIIVAEISELTTLAAEKGIKLKYAKPKKKLPKLMIDVDKMKDVVLNLIDNAIKYTQKGSVTVSAVKDDGTVTVTVKDTGIGIPPEQTKKLFDKFVRGEGIARIQPNGSGLGLYIAKRIVETHGGTIWVESDGTGKGSSFIFRIPIDGKE